MNRMKQLELYREEVNKILEKAARNREDIGLASIVSHLGEISDTLALMYDKMCEKEEHKNE